MNRQIDQQMQHPNPTIYKYVHIYDYLLISKEICIQKGYIRFKLNIYNMIMAFAIVQLIHKSRIEACYDASLNTGLPARKLIN